MSSTRARVRESSATGFHFPSLDHALKWACASAGAAARTAARMRESRPATRAATVPPNEKTTEGFLDGADPVLLHLRMGLQEADRSGRVRERGVERHLRRLVVAIREAQRGDADLGKRLARRDDVRLLRLAAETVQHRRRAQRLGVRKVQDALDLTVRDVEGDALQH